MGAIGLCVLAPGVFLPETEARGPRDSWFVITNGEVLLATVQSKGILAGAFSGTLQDGVLERTSTLGMQQSWPRKKIPGKISPSPSRSC